LWFTGVPSSKSKLIFVFPNVLWCDWPRCVLGFYRFVGGGIDWGSGDLTESYLSASFKESLIILSQDFLLEQIVTEPTRLDNILDLCFIFHLSCVCHSKIIPGWSDHAWSSDYWLVPSKDKPRRKMYCFKRADWTSLRNKVVNISIPHFQLNNINSKSVEENWTYTHRNLLQAIEACNPTKFNSSQKQLPWMTPHLKRLIRKKQRFYNKAKQSRTAVYWAH